MAKLIGNAPNQVPTNADLGSMAFEDKKNYATTSSPIYQPFRNILINGDMSIAQRSTSVASISSAGYYTVDRFQNQISSAGTWTLSQDTDVPTGQGFSKSLKYDCTTANASLSAGSFLQIVQRFEGQNLQYLKKGTANATSLTLSFWVKSNKTGTYIAELYDFDNSRQISKSYTINTANTWEKKTVTFEGDTTGAFDNDNGNSLGLIWWLGGGSTFTSGTLNTSWNSVTPANRAVGNVNLADNTANEWYVTGVQLEAGTTASDFEFLPVDVNLQRCLRYYYRTPNGAAANYQRVALGFSYSATAIRWNKQLPVIMRSHPSLTTSGNFVFYDGSSNLAASGFFLDGNQANDNIFIYGTATIVSGTAYRPGHISANSDNDATFIFDSEL